METPVQDVNTEAPSTSETAVNEQTAETTAPETTATTETTEQTQEVSQTTTPTAPFNAELYDERGVPWKNVAMEKARKYDETISNLPKLVAEEIAKTSQTQQPKQYSIAELEQFAQANPEHRAWVEQEKSKVLEDNLSKKFEARIEATTQKQREEGVRSQTFNRVTTNFPDIAIKDQQGNFLGWNNTNPMTQAMGRYMSDPRLANDPVGLEIAAKLAYADTMMAKTPQTQKVIQSLKSQVKKAQAATFVEAGGKRPGPENPNRKLVDRVRESGKISDGAEVMRNILRKQGSIKE